MERLGCSYSASSLVSLVRGLAYVCVEGGAARLLVWCFKQYSELCRGPG